MALKLIRMIDVRDVEIENLKERNKELTDTLQALLYNSSFCTEFTHETLIIEQLLSEE